MKKRKALLVLLAGAMNVGVEDGSIYYYGLL